MRIKLNFLDNQKFTHVSHISGENQFTEKTYRKQTYRKLFYSTEHIQMLSIILLNRSIEKFYSKGGKINQK